MSLHDKHLQQALKNAPDSDMAPSDAVRKKVLDYAEDTAQPKRVNFFKRCVKLFSDWRMTSWQLVGMGTVASVLFITVVLRGQLPGDSLWLDAGTQDIAQTEAEPATARPLQEDKLDTEKEEIAEAVAANSGVLELTMEPKIISRVEDEQARAKKSLATETGLVETKPTEIKLSRQLAKEVERPAIDFEDKVDAIEAAPLPTPIKNSPAAIAETVEADTFDSSAMQSEDRAVARMSRPKVKTKAKRAARKQVLPELAAVSGAALAKKDIQAGIFRILVTGSDWPANKPLFDDETGFQVQVVEDSDIKLSGDELETYNQTIRHWYRTNKNLGH